MSKFNDGISYWKSLIEKAKDESLQKAKKLCRAIIRTLNNYLRSIELNDNYEPQAWMAEATYPEAMLALQDFQKIKQELEHVK